MRYKRSCKPSLWDELEHTEGNKPFPTVSHTSLNSTHYTLQDPACTQLTKLHQTNQNISFRKYTQASIHNTVSQAPERFSHFRYSMFHPYPATWTLWSNNSSSQTTVYLKLKRLSRALHKFLWWRPRRRLQTGTSSCQHFVLIFQQTNPPSEMFAGYRDKKP